MDMTSHPLLRSSAPTYVVIDTESRYDETVHGRYLEAERFTEEDRQALSPRDAVHDPRIEPRWPCHQITCMSWLILQDGPDGLVPVRMETRGLPEMEEAAILAAFFADIRKLGPVQLVSWGGFTADLPQMLVGTMAAGLQLPKSLQGLVSPWRRDRAGHTDLLTEIAAGAKRPHMAEVAAKLGIPVKLTCRPDQVSKLMERGKWSDVKSVCEGDVLSLTAILISWLHLGGQGASPWQGLHRLSRFVAQHCRHRSYMAQWTEFGDTKLRQAFSKEEARIAVLAPQLIV